VLSAQLDIPGLVDRNEVPSSEVERRNHIFFNTMKHQKVPEKCIVNWRNDLGLLTDEQSDEIIGHFSVFLAEQDGDEMGGAGTCQ